MVIRSLIFPVIILFGVIMLLFTPVQAYDSDTVIPASELARADSFYPDTITSHLYHASITPHWIGNDTFWYADSGKQSTMFFMVNISQNVRSRAFDTDRFVASLTNVTGRTIDPAHLPITGAIISPDRGTISFDAFGKSWICDLSVYQMTDTTLPEVVNSGIRSPDLHYIAYVNGSNLNLYDTTTGVFTPLTTDGTDDYFYGKRSDTVRYPVTETRLNSTPAPYLVWSPDSSKIRTFRIDQRNVSPYYLVQNVPENGSLKPVLYTYRFATPGDSTIPMYEPVIIDVRTKQITPVNWQSQPETSMMDTDQDLLSRWNDSGDQIYTLFLERGEKTLRLLNENPATGVVREILNETGATYREANLAYTSTPNVAVLEKTGDVIWFSERDGWGHLYRYDLNGTLKNQITSGPWVVRDLVAVDEATAMVYFTASGKEPGNPYYRYLYRVGLDGSHLELLTPGNADHAIIFSPDDQTFVDAYSRVDLPTVTDLKSANGTLLMHLATADD